VSSTYSVDNFFQHLSLIQISSLDELFDDRSANDIWQRTVTSVRDLALKVFSNVVKNFDAVEIDPLPTTKNDVFKRVDVDAVADVDFSSKEELSTTMRNFVEKGNVPFCGISKTLHRKEGLEKLRRRLQVGRKELNAIIKKLELGSGMSEDAAKRSVLRQLGNKTNCHAKAFQSKEISCRSNRIRSTTFETIIPFLLKSLREIGLASAILLSTLANLLGASIR